MVTRMLRAPDGRILTCIERKPNNKASDSLEKLACAKIQVQELKRLTPAVPARKSMVGLSSDLNDEKSMHITKISCMTRVRVTKILTGSISAHNE